MLVRQYGTDPQNETRYSPAICVGCEKEEVFGDFDPGHISTSWRMEEIADLITDEDMRKERTTA